jgi:WhiB family redox-sensing transcriptional regulator
MTIEWMDSASCRSIDPIYWFPEPGISKRKGIAICRECPVLWECRAYSLSYRLEHGENFLDGIWGGLGPRERRQIAKAKALLKEALSMLEKNAERINA